MKRTFLPKKKKVQLNALSRDHGNMKCVRIDLFHIPCRYTWYFVNLLKELFVRVNRSGITSSLQRSVLLRRLLAAPDPPSSTRAIELLLLKAAEQW